LHGKTVTYCGARKRKEGSRRKQPGNSGELRFDTQADKEAGQSADPEGTDFGREIYPIAKRKAKKERATKFGSKAA